MLIANSSADQRSFSTEKERSLLLLKAGSSDYAVLSRRTFSRTTASARSNLAVQEGTRHSNALDKLESRLSARLPRIMDVTVTHVNEAHHLHLLHLPVLPAAYPLPHRAFDSYGNVYPRPLRLIRCRPNSHQ